MKIIIKTLFLLIVLYISSQQSMGQIINYENNPDLAIAIKYDLELNGGDDILADRNVAEQHYLKYLEKCTESFQKARVYYELGAMYSTAVNLRKSEKPDFSKAKFYFLKCIEEEPERIGRPTLFARTQMVGLSETHDERCLAGMEVYKWFKQIDSQKIKNNYLPIKKNDALTSASIDNLFNKITILRDTIEVNILSDAENSKNPEILLNQIISAFPHDRIREKAQNALKRAVQAKIDEQIPIQAIPSMSVYAGINKKNTTNSSDSLRENHGAINAVRAGLEKKPSYLNISFLLIIMLITILPVGMFLKKNYQRRIKKT